MNEMKRLREGTDDPELKALLSAGHFVEDLPDDVRNRSRKRVTALAGVPVAAGLMFWVQHAALGAALGVAVVAAAQAPRLFSKTNAGTSVSAAPTAVAPAPRATAVNEPESPPANAESELPAQNTAQPVERVPAPMPSANAVDLDAELALLDRARRELDTNAQRSLGMLERHRTEFIGSALFAEREILAITALVRLGRRLEAEGRAESLRQRIPGSLYAERLEGILREPR
jgi:hypothetical protein